MNVINDPWLFVKYLDGTKTQVSIRQAFIDAEKIKNIDTPIFHDTRVYIYEVPVIQLLVTIFEAVYFKPENNFAAHNKYFSKNIMKNGWDEQLILNYLDKWQDRFNLFDDKYPFMQDIKLKDNNIKSSDLSYISRTSLIAPGGNNLIFEHNDDKEINSYLDKYKFSEIELIYALLYNRVMGTSPMAKQYPNKSICANTTLFTINYGKNLFETIIYNCLPLRDSNCDDLYDRPVWELNSYEEINNYPIESIYKNVLLCTFFPCLPIYVIYNNDINDIILSRTDKDVVVNKESRITISNTYCKYNPWAIRTSIKEDEKEFEKYKEWTPSIKIINLCIDITKRLPSGFACNIVSSDYQANRGSQCNIYYRQYDGMKSNVLSYGKYAVSQDVFDILQISDNHNKAIEYQTIIKKISDKFNEFKNAGLSNNIINNCKLKFSKYSEQYFFNIFIKNIENKIILENTTNDLIKYAKKIIKELSDITNNPLKYAIAYKFFSGSINKLKEESYG